ncbi:Y-family DNA polymerase [Methylovirgula ligni]|uniref:Y-family DNA polymerase n=1 Tax=Methylovirgula ligni TaxID=569860 RepID=UPI001FE03898|nr:DNA polymerase Y family protein [Methylovirgula ligni]
MTRYLSLWLPSLATDRISRHSAAAREAPLATIAKVRSAQRLAAVNRAAARHGLKPGLALADARAILPELACCAVDEAAEAATLAAITDWCRRFTPLAALDPPDGAMLDITGAAHLFGGEAKLLDEIEARLATQGLAARAAIAPTPEAAWALARFGEARVIPEGDREEDLRRRLGALPLAALRLDAKTLADLAQAGLRRIGDLILRPRAPLAARFGKQLFVRLDALLGHAKTPITPRFEAPAYLAERRFAEPIVQRETIEATIRALAQELALLLVRQGEGARQLDVSLFGVDGRVRHLRAGTSRPLRDPAMIARLFREKIEAAGNIDERDPLDAGFGFDVVRLAAEAVERQDEDQAHWLGAATQDDLADLVDRLGARLGLRRVTRLDLSDTHWPEFAVTAVPFSASSTHRHGMDARHKAGHDVQAQSVLSTRPIRLLTQPEPIEAIASVPDGPPVRFRWRRVLHVVAAIEGPERIAPEWWKHSALTRDYFRAEDSEGRRFWLFREGLYETETAQPRWFLHGLFA